MRQRQSILSAEDVLARLAKPAAEIPSLTQKCKDRSDTDSAQIHCDSRVEIVLQDIPGPRVLITYTLSRKNFRSEQNS